MSDKTKLSPPWEIYRRKVEALFGLDPDIRTDWDENTRVLRLYVNDASKADALDKLLPGEVEFGAVELNIRVIPENEYITKAQLYRRALEGNPLFSRTAAVDLQTNTLTYVVFRPRPRQFYGDNLGDINGNVTLLAADLARDVFGTDEGVSFCSDSLERG